MLLAPRGVRPSRSRISSRCWGEALPGSQSRPGHGHRARERGVLGIPGGSPSPAVFSTRKSPRQCTLSIGDSQRYLLLRCQAEEVPLLLRGYLCLLIICHTCVSAGLCPITWCPGTWEPQLKCARPACSEHGSTARSSSARRGSCEAEPRRAKRRYLMAHAGTASPDTCTPALVHQHIQTSAPRFLSCLQKSLGTFCPGTSHLHFQSLLYALGRQCLPPPSRSDWGRLSSQKMSEALLLHVCRAQRVHVSVWLCGCWNGVNSSHSTEQSTWSLRQPAERRLLSAFSVVRWLSTSALICWVKGSCSASPEHWG